MVFPPNPNITRFNFIRAAIPTNVPYIAMVGNWTRTGINPDGSLNPPPGGEVIPQPPEQFKLVLDAVKGEQNICIYHAS